MKKAVFWNLTPCDSCRNRCSDIVFFGNVRRLLVTDNVVPISPILVTLMMEALCSYETSVLAACFCR
jgi:hypothetical protein